ncbi:hypothetical protein ABB37_02291 [Leptomonas pyrrhocoris]|uniref:ICAM-L protein n=1 Tax=Leptomonas pyrrhocoris TaxID=157538 RepID=A0A0N0DYM1_LEPPY|nr:hypothetical protein ABB37_02291 [Leptomonas pyrrhocoris]XP_015662691.1 hypothetical protein ABB37_02291 [Leptomonas pyrrhocoris]KPA84251.1 hypothetical protein ABB37_02291 [Leptomonas pyrrhocoris]KPA84252.1 hypothetical protein ABB37_02291 [Leptomonas pyrrhocoris]|eukprot:XP_015662690.1 hypothetical protein ABB37_02291 [Leptomonas pyrrhocoris]
MGQQRKKEAAAALVRDVPDPAPFFSLGAAQFRDAIVVTKVVSVVLPLRHMRDRTILHEMVLKKLLHRSFEPSAEDLAQQPSQHDETGTSKLGLSSSPATDVYVIVHIKSVEVHADTARQGNPQGDVQVNVMTTLVAAHVQHGLVAGVAERSPFATCMLVRLPNVAVSAAVASNESASAADALNLASVTLEGGNQRAKDDEEGKETSSPQPLLLPSNESGEVPVDRQLRVTARCLEEEPVVPGQAVLLVSEPAAMRCLAVRPPRDAPGPFFFSEDTTVGPIGAAVAAAAGKRRRPSRRTTQEGQDGAEVAQPASATGRRVVVIACNIPKTADGADGGHKRPRW